MGAAITNTWKCLSSFEIRRLAECGRLPSTTATTNMEIKDSIDKGLEGNEKHVIETEEEQILVNYDR